MRIPYVIDNEEHILADVLRAVLQEHGGRALDIASAYRELREGLNELGSVRLLLGFEPPDLETGGRQHFWRYYDAHMRQIVDNRYVIAELIKCSADTPRVIGELDVFEIQEKVVADILQSVQTQAAVEAAPAIVDPVQQTLVTLLGGYLNSPAVKRAEVRAVMAELRRPATTAQIKRLKEAYTAFNAAQDIALLLSHLKEVVEVTAPPVASGNGSGIRSLTREDLRLICFDHVVG